MKKSGEAKESSIFCKILNFVYPVIQAYKLNKNILPPAERHIFDAAVFTQREEQMYESIGDVENADILLGEAQKIKDVEDTRRELINGKAAAIIGASGLTVTIIGIMQSTNLNISKICGGFSIAAAICFAIAIFYLLSATICSVHVIRCAGYYESSSDLISKASKTKNSIEKTILAEKLANVEMNYPRVIVKSNYLDSAQALFIRGVVFIGIASFMLLLR